jgi:hypothetical protein
VRRPLVVTALVLAAAVALTAVPAARAPAKEHTAACAELGGMLARVRSTMKAANGHRLRGSSLGAYQVLQSTAASMARDSGGRRCGALGPTLNAALARAAASRSALDASLALDQGIEAALSLAGDGRLPRDPTPAKLLPVGEAALYGEGCPDVFEISQRLDGPRGTLSDRVGAVLADLRAHPRCVQVRALLERAAPEGLAHAVDSIRLDEPDRVDATADLTSRCPELPIVVDHLAAAITVGAPQFNAGDAAACRKTYEAAAAAVAARIVPEGRCPTVRTLLSAGLKRAKEAASDREAAWDLRHSFDAILSEGPDASP